MRTWPMEAFTELSRYSPRIKVSTDKALAEIDSRRPNRSPDMALSTPAEILAMATIDNCLHLGKALASLVQSSDIDWLVAHVSLDNAPVSWVALAGLRQLAPASLLPWLSELWLSIPEGVAARSSNRYFPLIRRAVLLTALALPQDSVLPLARAWIFQEDERKHRLAERIFEEHAKAEDIPTLRKLLGRMLVDEDAEWRCFSIEAFNRFPNLGVVPELIEIFHRFRFSLGRAYAVEAIEITSPEYFRDHLALECLWDCEDRTRDVAAEHAPMSLEGVEIRLRQLAEDFNEDEEIRVKARSRLGQ